MFASVLISYQVKSLDKTFTYKIPTNLNVKVGMKVRVPFGKVIINGFVMAINNTCEDEYNLKEIISVVDDKFILNDELIELGKYLKEKTLCSLMTAYETMLPKGIKAKSVKTDYNKYITYLKLNKNIGKINEYIKKNARFKSQIDILENLLKNEKVLKSEYSLSSINTLIKKDLIKEIKEQVYRINKSTNEVTKMSMNEDQQSVFNSVSSSFNTFKPFLLFGITGSGKTFVYINLIKECIKNGKTAIMLVPEISLTAQTSRIFYDYFDSSSDANN